MGTVRSNNIAFTCLQNPIMKFALCFVALAVLASVQAAPQPLSEPVVGPTYFSGPLSEIQGAIYDTIRAGMDLETMETRLQGIADASSYFFRAESAIEYAVDSAPYKNGWNAPQAQGTGDK